MTEKVILAHRHDCDASAVARILGTHGYETRSVHDGNSLLDLATAWRPEAAVIDLGLDKRPALAAGSALRNWFGGDIQLVGLTIPSDPAMEKHALDAGFDHVVVEVGDAAEVLLALSGPGAQLVRRGQDAALAFANTMVAFAGNCLLVHSQLPKARARRNIAMMRRTLATIAQSLDGDLLDREQAGAVRLALSSLERKFEKLVRPQDGQGAP